MWLVPVVAIIFAIGLPLSIPIIYLALSFQRRRRLMELHHAERMAAIERGMELPPLPPEVLGERASRRSTLLAGLIWLLVGLALMAGLHEIDGHGLAGLSVWGLVPMAVGVAFLVYYFVEDRKHLQPPREKP